MTDQNSQPTKSGRYFFPVSPLMLFPQTSGHFAVYLKQDEAFVLYTKAHEVFTAETRQRLFESGVEDVYVLQQQKEAYDRYVEDQLGRILMSPRLPMKERARVFYGVSVTILQEAFDTRLPPNLGGQFYKRLKNFVEEGIKFLGQGDSLKNVAKLISHDYRTYSHSVQVFVYSCSLLQSFGWDGEELVKVGVGALLHDIGKTKIPHSILNKPGKLDKGEWQIMQTHPVQGVALCSGLPLTQEMLNCILFHHERVDGKGYPAGMTGEQLGLPVKAITVCDVYDALISDRPYAAGVTPFEALSIMRDEMEGAFDDEVYRRLIMVLSGADIVDMNPDD